MSRALAAYRRAFARGATDLIEIEKEDGSTSVVDLLAKVTAHARPDLVGAIQKSSFSILLLNHGLETFGEPREGDLVKMRGKTYAITAEDPHTRAAGGVALAYALAVEG
jgi:hypothetical protein